MRTNDHVTFVLIVRGSQHWLHGGFLLRVACVHGDCLRLPQADGHQAGHSQSFINNVSSRVISFPNNYPAYKINGAILIVIVI
jgi:hypothetical protein